MRSLPAQRPTAASISTPAGFPLFSTRDAARIVTADPWAFLLHIAEARLPRDDERRACAFICQGKEFFESARSSNDAGKPLFYYYAFLNVLKAALIVRRQPIPVILRHGINDPRHNRRTRLSLPGQSVHVPGRASDNSEFFPEVLASLGWMSCANKTWPVTALLAQIPSIHRTYTKVAREGPFFVPVRGIHLRGDGKSLWCQLSVSTADRDASLLMPTLAARRKFTTLFREVKSEDALRRFETLPLEMAGQTQETAIRVLAASLHRLGISSILTGSGFRYYIGTQTESSFMPRLAAAYAIFFYLGSITRYRPYDFEKIVQGKWRWIVEELLATEPNQMLYSTASWLAGTEVVRPFAVID